MTAAEETTVPGPHIAAALYNCTRRVTPWVRYSPGVRIVAPERVEVTQIVIVSGDGMPLAMLPTRPIAVVQAGDYVEVPTFAVTPEVHRPGLNAEATRDALDLLGEAADALPEEFGELAGRMRAFVTRHDLGDLPEVTLWADGSVTG